MACFYKNWDGKYAEELANKFQLNMKVKYHKLSRYANSCWNYSRISKQGTNYNFDEPTTGLGAAHRELFYSLLLEDYGEYPWNYYIIHTFSRRSNSCD